MSREISIITARDFRFINVFEKITQKSLNSVKYFDVYALSLEFDCKLNQ